MASVPAVAAPVAVGEAPGAPVAASVAGAATGTCAGTESGTAVAVGGIVICAAAGSARVGVGAVATPA